MRLLVLPLMGLVMVGEALNAFEGNRPLSRIFYIWPNPIFNERMRVTQPIMLRKPSDNDMPLLGLGSRRPSVGLHSMSFVPSPTRQYLPVHDQANSYSDDPSFAPSIPARNPSHVIVHHNRNPSSFHQPPKPSTVNDKVPFPESKPAVFVQGFKAPTFNPHNGFASPQDVTTSSEQGHKPSNSDEDNNHSSFGQEQESFDMDQKTPKFDTLGSQPNRNPVCNVLPDPGTCRAALPRYYLDPETGTCNCYLYGGCTENGSGESPGSFFTLEECQRECHPPKMEEGPVCKDIFKEEQFVSFLDEPLPSKNTHTDHFNDQEFLASFPKQRH